MPDQPVDPILDRYAEAIAEKVAARLRESPPVPGRQYLTIEEAAYFLGFQPRGLWQLRAQGLGPPATRIGKRAVRFEIEALKAWAASRPTETEDNPNIAPSFAKRREGF